MGVLTMASASHLRSIALAAAITLYPAAGRAADNFSCGSFFCGCDINVPTDCDKMKKNCKGGKISACSGTACFCAPAVAGLKIGTPKHRPPREIQKLLAPKLKATPQ